jgi:hypothetical protein
VRDVAREAAARDYRLSAIVLGIVRSAPFQMKKAPPPDAQQVATVRKDSGLSSRLEE